MVQTTIHHRPSQLGFGKDVNLNIKLEANWQSIKQRKEVLIIKGTQKNLP